MWALIFTVMWANVAERNMELEPPAQFPSEMQCAVVGSMLEATVARRYAGDPRGHPTAIHWWCVPTDARGVI